MQKKSEYRQMIAKNAYSVNGPQQKTQRTAKNAIFVKKSKEDTQISTIAKIQISSQNRKKNMNFDKIS